MSLDECIEKQFLFLKKNSVLHIPMSFRNLINREYDIYEEHTLSGWDFVWLMFQSVIDLESKQTSLGIFPSLLETVYKTYQQERTQSQIGEVSSKKKAGNKVVAKAGTTKKIVKKQVFEIVESVDTVINTPKTTKQAKTSK